MLRVSLKTLDKYYVILKVEVSHMVPVKEVYHCQSNVVRLEPTLQRAPNSAVRLVGCVRIDQENCKPCRMFSFRVELRTEDLICFYLQRVANQRTKKRQLDISERID